MSHLISELLPRHFATGFCQHSLHGVEHAACRGLDPAERLNYHFDLRRRGSAGSTGSKRMTKPHETEMDRSSCWAYDGHEKRSHAQHLASACRRQMPSSEAWPFCQRYINLSGALVARKPSNARGQLWAGEGEAVAPCTLEAWQNKATKVGQERFNNATF